MNKRILITKLCGLFVVFGLLSGCVGTVIGTAVDVAVEVVKVPFKVGGAVIDVVTGDDLTEEGTANELKVDLDETDEESDQHAVSVENQGL